MRECQWLCLMLVGWLSLQGMAADGGAIPVEIQRQGDRYQLVRNGQPYAIKGAVYWADSQGRFPLREVRACGANAVRCGGRYVPQIFDEAAALGMTVVIGLPLRGEYTDGFDYDDEEAVRRQREEIRQRVLRYKDHPALLMWGIGNEWALFHKNDKVFEAVEDVARMIHEIDGRHPTMTVTGDNPFDEAFMRALKVRCPSVDVLGVNVYQGLMDLPATIRRLGWDKPYCVTEWGPTGHWQVPKTTWRAPIEETSTEKAAVYRQRYEAAIAKDTERCLGSYVFFWGQKQEQTHTWYGMFLASGQRLGTVDVMQYLWTGRWPTNRAPALTALSLDGKRAIESLRVSPGSLHEAAVEVADPDGDPLRLEWEVLPEPTAFGYGGRGERKPAAVSDLLVDETARGLRFRAPGKEGAYRLFVTILDGQGHAATGNVPFFVAAD